MPNLSYYQLDPDKVEETITALRRRIDERFPGAGLTNVARTLESACTSTRERARWIERPNWPLRIGTWLFLAAAISAIIFSIITLDVPDDGLTLIDFLPLLEAVINDLVLLGAGAFFLLTLETRIKRSRGLRALHELRSIAHVIDMHQLTKDPERLLKDHETTESSPTLHMTPFALRRYLDYCSELLSLTGKIASIYLNRIDDPAIVAAVQEIEQLTNGLSRKIWQKINATQAFHGHGE